MIGAIHRNRFAARVAELLETAAMPELSASIEALLRVRESPSDPGQKYDPAKAVVGADADGVPTF